MKKAKWYFNGFTPTLQDYLPNALISVSTPVIFVHAYCVLSIQIKKEALENLLSYNKCQNIVRRLAMILRLSDDLGTLSVYFHWYA